MIIETYTKENSKYLIFCKKYFKTHIHYSPCYICVIYGLVTDKREDTHRVYSLFILHDSEYRKFLKKKIRQTETIKIQGS